MKTTLNGRLFNRASLLAALLVSLFSTVQVQAQLLPANETALAASMNESIMRAIDNLNADWDRRSYNMAVRSNTYAKMRTARESAPSTFAVYSFKGNVEAASNSKEADNQLKKTAILLRKATDELAEVYKQKHSKGQLKQLKPLLDFLGFSVSNIPIPVRKLDVSRSKVTNLTMAEWALSGLVAEALTHAAEQTALSSNSMQKKHLAFKYLAASVLTIPAIWVYLDPEFTRLARVGGATTDNLYFAKLYMDQVPFFEEDSRIWREAPRFYRSQLKVSNPANKSGVKIELSDTETKVSVGHTIGNHEVWFRFDENTVLVDSETGERYPIKRIEGGIPLGKTIVLVGCSGSTVDFTFVFPRVKPSTKSFYIDEVDPSPSSEAGRKAYFKAHNIMSDGSSTLSKTVYNLSDYVSNGQPATKNELNTDFEKTVIDYYKQRTRLKEKVTKDTLCPANPKFMNAQLNLSISKNPILFETNHLIIKNPYYAEGTNNYPKSYSVIYQDCLIALFENGKFSCFNLSNYERDVELENKLNTRKFEYHWIVDKQLCGLSDNKLLVWNGKNWEPSKNAFPLTKSPKLFDDDKFVVYGDCSGEWGGTVYFYEKATGKTFFTESTCSNTVTKSKDGYEVLASLGHGIGSSELKVIADPRKLTLAKPSEINKLVNGEALGYTDTSNAYTKRLHLSGTQIYSMFTYGDRTLYLVPYYTLVLAELKNNAFELVHPLFMKNIYLNYPLTSVYGDYTLINLGHYQTALDREISVLIIHKNTITKIDWNTNQFH